MLSPESSTVWVEDGICHRGVSHHIIPTWTGIPLTPLWIHSSKKKKVAQKKEKGPDYTPTDVQSWGFDEPNFRKAFFSRFKPSNFHEQYRYHPKRETPSVANPLVNSGHYGDMNTDRGASLLSSSPFVKVFLVPYCLTVCYSLNLSERSEIYSSLFAGLNF